MKYGVTVERVHPHVDKLNREICVMIARKVCAGNGHPHAFTVAETMRARQDAADEDAIYEVFLFEFDDEDDSIEFAVLVQEMREDGDLYTFDAFRHSDVLEFYLEKDPDLVSTYVHHDHDSLPYICVYGRQANMNRLTSYIFTSIIGTADAHRSN